MPSYDVAIIGGGPGGYVAAIRACSHPVVPKLRQGKNSEHAAFATPSTIGGGPAAGGRLQRERRDHRFLPGRGTDANAGVSPQRQHYSDGSGTGLLTAGYLHPLPSVSGLYG